MTGLADGVNHIHNLGPAKLGPVDAKTKIHGNRDNTGYHHDLKLKNILVFDQDILKISDFGTARIQQVSGRADGRSHQTIHLMGDPDYVAPDYLLTERASRPYDVWALGCIFLEMLVWACSDAGAVDQFHTDRRHAEETNIETASFWYKDGNSCDLKQAVKDTINNVLKPRLTGFYVSESLLELVQGMLCIHVKSDKHPKGRMKITKVRTELEKSLAQARLDLSDDEDCFKFPGVRVSTPTFGDTSTVDGRNDRFLPRLSPLKTRRHSISTFPLPSALRETEAAPRTSAPDAIKDTLQAGEQFSELPPQNLVGDGWLRPAVPSMGEVVDHDTAMRSPIDGLNNRWPPLYR